MGRRRALNDEQVAEVWEMYRPTDTSHGWSVRAIARYFGVTPSVINAVLNRKGTYSVQKPIWQSPIVLEHRPARIEKAKPGAGKKALSTEEVKEIRKLYNMHGHVPKWTVTSLSRKVGVSKRLISSVLRRINGYEE